MFRKVGAMIDYSLLRSELECQSKTEGDIDTFIKDVNNLVMPFIHDEKYRLFWVGAEKADEGVKCIITGILNAYPEVADRISTNPYMEIDAVVVFDMVAAEEEFRKNRLL
jgi:hypothetical protein